jgi:ribonuclease P protein component
MPLQRGDFWRVTRQGRRSAGGLVTVYALSRKDDLVRAGVAAGRRVGGAVTRNRARRLIREAWRSLAARARAGVDLVLVAGPGIDGARMQDVAEELEDRLRQAGVIE